MPNSSVHFPNDLLEEIDRMAAEEGLSRNKFIVESCRAMLQRGRSSWPPGFFSNEHLKKADLEVLEESGSEFDAAISRGRRNRKKEPF